MNSERQRDAIDRLLRQSLHEQADAVPADACLEADVLAAWVDGTLTRDELVRAESHAASCSRCQAILTSMVRIAPAAPRHAWWARTATVRWLVPITAVAAIAFWIAVPPRPARAPAVQLAENRDAGAVALPRPMVPPSASAPDESARELFKTREAPRDAVSERRKEAPLAAGKLDRKQQQDDARSDKAKDEQRLDAIAPAAAPTRTEGGLAQSPPSAGAPARAFAPPPPPPAAAAPQAAVAEPVVPSPPAAKAAVASPDSAARAGAPAAVANESVATAASFLAGRGGAPGLFVIASPDPAVRWRFGGTGTVQRSADAGVTWTTQQIGTTVPVSAGSSPSARVCWLVGRAGTVLLSSDGATWQLRPFPEGADLVSVRATDARNATVTAADGRTFSTADGGATWARPQELPPAPFYE